MALSGCIYNVPTNRLLSVTAGSSLRTFAHDSAGNLTQDQRSGVTDCHRYDAFARLAQFERYGANVSCVSPGMGAATTASYVFNGLNQRSYKQVGGVGTRFVYAPSGELLYEIDTTGKQRHYIWFEGRLIALNTNASNHANTYFVKTDDLARPYRITNTSGATVWSATLRVFDRVAQPGDSIGGFNLGFPGQYYDSESGLWQNWHRTYDASVGSYTQSDPIGLAAGINTYSYVGRDPVSLTDPTGLAATVVAQELSGGGYSFYAFGDGRSGAIYGTFNTSTFNVNQLSPGTYTVSPRPTLDTPWWNPFSQINANAGRPTTSNSCDWNTVIGANGSCTRGAQSHAGRNGGAGGVSRDCMVSDQNTFNQLNSLFQANYQNGGATLIILPSGWMGS